MRLAGKPIPIAIGAVLAAAGCATVTAQPDAVDAQWDPANEPDAAWDAETGDDTGTDTEPDPPGDSCPPGTTDCLGTCVDLMTDEDNCQYCGNACPDTFLNATGVCVDGVCGWLCDPSWADADDEPGCETPCPAGGIETCNGMDDDCDGTADDGFPCRLGQILTCETTCSTFGTGVCLFPCALPTAASCVPPAELCNGIDDDCDEGIDEDWPPGTCSSCTPDCSGRECGPDPACGTSCGSCTLPETCSTAGACACLPDCSGRECGMDPVCGTSCGTCTPPESCIATGNCV